MQNARRVVLGIAAGESRVSEHRCAQLVVGVKVSPAHTFVDHLLQRGRRVFQPAIHAPLDKDIDDARVLANRAMPLCAHPAVGQDLRDGILCGRRPFCLICVTQRADIIHRVEVADILQRVGDTIDQICIADNYCHGDPRVSMAPAHNARRQ